jgi:hypothetical protein
LNAGKATKLDEKKDVKNTDLEQSRNRFLRPGMFARKISHWRCTHHEKLQRIYIHRFSNGSRLAITIGDCHPVGLCALFRERRRPNAVPREFLTEFVSAVGFPFLHVTVSGRGQATHMGNTAAVTDTQLVNLIDGSRTATYKLTAPIEIRWS